MAQGVARTLIGHIFTIWFSASNILVSIKLIGHIWKENKVSGRQPLPATRHFSNFLMFGRFAYNDHPVSDLLILYYMYHNRPVYNEIQLITIRCHVLLVPPTLDHCYPSCRYNQHEHDSFLGIHVHVDALQSRSQKPCNFYYQRKSFDLPWF